MKHTDFIKHNIVGLIIFFAVLDGKNILICTTPAFNITIYIYNIRLNTKFLNLLQNVCIIIFYIWNKFFKYLDYLCRLILRYYYL